MDSIELVIGIITLIPMAIGYVIAGLLIGRYFLRKKVIVLITAFMFISLVSIWIGVCIIFFIAIFNLPTPSDMTYIFSFAWAIPILATTWNFITAALFEKQKFLKFIILGLFFVVDVIFLLLIYWKQDFIIEPNSMIYRDTSFGIYTSIILYFYVASILLFIMPTYFWKGINSKLRSTKFKNILVACGSLLFSIIAILDGIITIDNLPIAIVNRTILILALIILSMGYFTPLKLDIKLDSPTKTEKKIII
ncbi:MAG TPA: hypothetical protein VMX55_13370 [candidate division Zixibacteria bacterium]|nr:hypothetical protein [candidate division Zixibacteria bacterium]